MLFNTLTLILSLAGAVAPFPTLHTKRADSDIDLYAYGTGISGLQLWGSADGKHPLRSSYWQFNILRLILTFAIRSQAKHT